MAKRNASPAGEITPAESELQTPPVLPLAGDTGIGDAPGGDAGDADLKLLPGEPPTGDVTPAPAIAAAEPLLPLFEVQLRPHNPGTRLVRAADETEALKEYFRTMGIVQSDNQPKITRIDEPPTLEA